MPVIELEHDKKPRSKRFKYHSFIAALPEMRAAYLSGAMTYEDLYMEFNPQCELKFKVSQLRSYGSRQKWGMRRRKVAAEVARNAAAKAKADAERKAIEEARAVERRRADELAEAAAQQAIRRITEGQNKHFDRIEKALDKAAEVVDAHEPSEDSVEWYLKVADKLDSMGRRLYKMDGDGGGTPQQFNLAVLVGVPD